MSAVATVGLAIGMLTLETLDGHRFELANYDERRGTVLVFLSSRCPVTQEAIDTIEAMHEETRHQGILYVGLFADDDESVDEIREFCQRRAVRFPVYRDRGGAIARKLGASRTPEAFLIDSKGTMVRRGGFAPESTAKRMEEAVGLLIAGKPQANDPGHAVMGTNIGEIDTPAPVDDRYGVVSFSSELIFEHIPGAPVHHCSTLAEAPNGDLLCVWYGGSYESADDQVLFVSRRKQGEGDWSVPEVLVKGDPLHPPGNALVFRAGPNRLGLLWGRMDSSRPLRRGGGWGECQLMARYSDDDGHTWTPDAEMDGLYACLPRNAPLTLQTGELAVPLSGKTDEARGGFLLVTGDAGATWRRSGVMRGGSQPTVIQRDDGSLLALLRSEPMILRSESRDLGKTWTKPEKTDLRCPGSGIAMCRLANGHLILVYNDSPNSDRTPLNIVRSTDEGATWTEQRILEPNWGEYSYPCVIQTSDGKIHITYTFRRYAIKHLELNEDWLVHLLRPN
jgi:predicted neuraminidase/peroxiredoxin